MYDIVIGRSESDKQKHAIYGSIFLGKHYVKMGQTTSLSSKVYLDVAKSHVVFIVGKRGSGKSYTMGVIAEGIYDLPDEVKSNLSVILLDTMGIYWTMKYPNNKERDIIEPWGVETKGLDVQIFTPAGHFEDFKEKGIPCDYPFSIKTSELNADEWCMIFNVSMTDPIGILVEKVINDLKDAASDYDIDDIVDALKKEEAQMEIKGACENRFIVAKKWGLFSKDGTKIEDLVLPGQITVLDVSVYTTTSGAQNLRALVIGLVSQRLFNQRMAARRAEEEASIAEEIHFFGEEAEKKKDPIVWLVIDEAHEFLPIIGKTAATAPLITVLREGRQPGISLVLASQQPGKIHTDVFTQADVVISHRLTAQIDTTALGNIMQSYMREGLDKQLNNLPQEAGAAIIFDDTNERLYPIKIRPRYTWHGGSSPSALPREKKIFEL